MPRLENSHGSVAATRFRARPCSRETGRSLLYPDVHAFRECRLLRRKTIPDAKPMPSVIRFGDHVRLELHPRSVQEGHQQQSKLPDKMGSAHFKGVSGAVVQKLF
jgi:hypothetical protein